MLTCSIIEVMIFYLIFLRKHLNNIFLNYKNNLLILKINSKKVKIFFNKKTCESCF